MKKLIETYEAIDSYNYITTLGIEDELQDDIFETTKIINKTHEVSMCTGDRKETAVEISRQSGILNYPTIEIGDIKDKQLYTFLFSGDDVTRSMKGLNEMEEFKRKILESKKLHWIFISTG